MRAADHQISSLSLWTPSLTDSQELSDLLVGIDQTQDPELGSAYLLQELGDGRIWTEETLQRQSIVTRIC